MPEKSADIKTLVGYCDTVLRTREIQDWDGAVNGLQVEGPGPVRRIAAAVDASLTTVRLAVAQGADLLLVHHGLFWAPSHPWTGPRYELIRELVESRLSVYSSHLPLDLHPRLGNNFLLARALGLSLGRPFFPEKGSEIGLRFDARLPLDDLAARMERTLGRPPVILPGGPKKCRHIGIVTGGAGAELKRAAQSGVDTFITGEGPHWTFAIAEDLGINVLYGGHYATETFGVRALAEKLSRRFHLPWVFIDHPTGL